MNKFQRLMNRAKKLNLSKDDKIDKFLDDVYADADDNEITYPERDNVIDVLRARREGRKI